MKRLLYFCILILSVCIGCKENPVGPSSPSLIGKWNWVKSVGGFTGGTFTPQTEHHTSTIVFAADSSYRMYLNDSLAASSTFSLREETMNGGSVEMIYYPLAVPAQIVSRLDADTLILSDYAADGFTSTWNRIN